MRPQDVSKHEESKILYSDLQENQRKMVTKQIDHILTNSARFINTYSEEQEKPLINHFMKQNWTNLRRDNNATTFSTNQLSFRYQLGLSNVILCILALEGGQRSKFEVSLKNPCQSANTSFNSF